MCAIMRAIDSPTSGLAPFSAKLAALEVLVVG